MLAVWISTTFRMTVTQGGWAGAGESCDGGRAQGAKTESFNVLLKERLK